MAVSDIVGLVAWAERAKGFVLASVRLDFTAEDAASTFVGVSLRLWTMLNIFPRAESVWTFGRFFPGTDVALGTRVRGESRGNRDP